MAEAPTHEELVTRARGGDRRALDQLMREMKDLVYNLAIRMLGTAADAEDASQEILIRLVTNLDSFRGESAFRTWVYRVASNQLLTTRKRKMEEKTESFDAVAEHLDRGIAADLPGAHDELVVMEAKLICTSRMVLCLDRDHRLAFILGEIFEIPSDEAAAVLEVSSDAYRKRLSRARTRMEEFANARCGIVDAANKCRCDKQAANAQQLGLIDPARLTFATHPTREAKRQLDQIDGLARAIALHRSAPTYAAPDSLVTNLRELLVDHGN
jgi:RNA polymerase sigma factor (sigma-70 family)